MVCSWRCRLPHTDAGPLRRQRVPHRLRQPKAGVQLAPLGSPRFAAMPGHNLRNTGSLTGMSRINASLTQASASEQVKDAVNSVSVTSSLIDTSTINLSYAKPTVTSSGTSYTIGGD